MASPSLINRLRSAMRGLALPSPARVVVAVSGGPDSLCLLHALHTLREALGLELHVAHLDHAFRGAQSAAEAAFVADFASRLGLPATVERRDVPALIAATGLNAQAAARAVRYAFLAEVALAQGAHAVAVAHHADDQAETVLMHLLRGAGPAGLRGMRPVVTWEEWSLPLLEKPAAGARLVRPLLTARRSEIEAYCAANGLEPRRDPSNEAPRYARTRVRAGLLPLLAQEQPLVVNQLAHTAAICADDYGFIQDQLDERWPKLVEAQGAGFVAIDGAVWRALHPALQRYALRRAALLVGAEEPGFEQVEEARRVALLPVGARCDLPGGARLVVGYNGFALQRGAAGELGEGPQLQGGELPVAVPGITEMGNGWVFEARTSEPPDWAPGGWCAVLDAAALGGPLTLRARRPSDRMRLAAGTRSLQNLFVDAKLPRALREHWPLLASPNGIAWAVGLRIDVRFALREDTAKRLWVRCTQTGDR